MGKGWGSGTQGNWDSQRQHKGGTKGSVPGGSACCRLRSSLCAGPQSCLRTEARGADVRTRPRQQGCCD